MQPAEIPPSSDSGAATAEPTGLRVTRALIDGLLHDVRNPLNALSIHLEVLAEKLKRENGAVSPAQDKNLRSMREQIVRAGAILNAFAELLSTSDGEAPGIDFSALVRRAVDVLHYQARRAQVELKLTAAPGVRVLGFARGAGALIAVEMILRAIRRSPQGQEVRVTLKVRGQAELEVEDLGPSGWEPFPDALATVGSICTAAGVKWALRGRQFRMGPMEVAR